MTDQIPADKVREILDEWERIKEHADWDDLDTLVKDIRALLPTPPRPTLADMTPQERTRCRWMQADVANRSVRYVIANPYDDDADTALVSADGEIGWFLPGRVTPRPDLPRLEWPGDEKPAPAPALPDGWRLADHPDLGRVIVTTTTPDRYGRVYYVLPSAECMWFDWLFCTPAELTYIDQEADTADTVPESTMAVGSVWDDADALARACEETGRDQITVTDRNGDVSVWDGRRDDWRSRWPIPKSAPFTIIHTGKEADQ